MKTVYNLVKDAYEGEAVIPLNKRGTKSPEKLSVGNPICEAGLAIRKDGKTTDGGGGIPQKYCCPFHQSTYFHTEASSFNYFVYYSVTL